MTTVFKPMTVTQFTLALSLLAAASASSPVSAHSPPLATIPTASALPDLPSLFFEDVILPLFLNGTTVLTMEYQDDEEKMAAEGLHATDGEEKGLQKEGWFRWWHDQFEKAAVFSPAASAIVSPSAPSSPHDRPLLPLAFSMADFDRMLVTTGGIDSTFDEINRQLRKNICSPPPSAAGDNVHSSSCPRECHPVSEVDELAASSLYFRQKLGKQKLLPAAGEKGSETDNEKVTVAAGDLGKTIAGAFKLPSREKEALGESPQQRVPNSTVIPSIFTTKHFIESFTTFIQTYYDDRVEGDDANNSPSFSPSFGTTINLQRFFNTSSLVKECRGRSERMAKAARRESKTRELHKMKTASTGTTQDRKEDGRLGQHITRAQLVNRVHSIARQIRRRQMQELSPSSSSSSPSLSPSSSSSSSSSPPSSVAEFASQLVREAFPSSLREQYVCFLKFFSDQPSFLPMAGAMKEAELWVMNIGQQRLEGLERGLIEGVYAGKREVEPEEAAAEEGQDVGDVYKIPSPDAANDALVSTDSRANGGRSTRSTTPSSAIPQILSNTHVIQQKMSPLRQLSHKSGKTLVVRDADGRHPLLRHLQLLIKQWLFGAEASAIDVNAQLVYEPPPKVTKESIWGLVQRNTNNAKKTAGGETQKREQEKEETFAQMRFSSQPPRYDNHDTILILLGNDYERDNSADTPSSSRPSSPPLSQPSSLSHISPAAVDLVVTFQRSGTHCHLPTSRCGEAEGRSEARSASSGTDPNNYYGGKVEKEFYYGQTATTATTVVPTAEALVAMPTVVNSCLRKPVDFYTHPTLSRYEREVLWRARQGAKKATALEDSGEEEDDDNDEESEGDDLNHLAREVRTFGGNTNNLLAEQHSSSSSAAVPLNTNMARVFLSRPGDMLYIPRGMIYSLRTMRRIRSSAMADDSNKNGGASSSSPHETSSSSSQEQKKAIVALDGVLFLMLSIEPQSNSGNSDPATYSALLQSVIREAYFAFNHTTDDTDPRRVTNQKETKKEEGRQSTNGKTSFCHNRLNAVGDIALIQRDRNPNTSAETSSPRMHSMNPFRSPILNKDMGDYAEPEEEEQGVKSSENKKQIATAVNSNDNDNGELSSGFMKLGRRNRKGAKNSKGQPSSLASPPPARLPFPAACFNEVHVAMLVVDALLPHVPALRKAVVRIPSIGAAAAADVDESSSCLVSSADRLVQRNATTANSAIISPSSFSYVAYSRALYERHLSILEQIKKGISAYLVGEAEEEEEDGASSAVDSNNAATTNKETTANARPAVDPAAVLKKWTKLVLGTVLTEPFLYSRSPLWYQESTPFRERMVVKKGGTDQTRSTKSHAIKKHEQTEGEANDTAFFSQCSMRAADIIKLLASSGSVRTEEVIGVVGAGAPPPAVLPLQQRFGGRSVVSWKHNHALEVASPAMRDVIVRDLVLGEALVGRLMTMGENRGEGRDKNEEEVAHKEGTEASHSRPPPSSPLLRPWLSSIAHRKHKYRAGTHFWAAFNAVMSASGAYDVDELDEAMLI